MAKVYIVVSPGQTDLFTIRQDARNWSKQQGGVILEHQVSPATQGKIANMIQLSQEDLI